MKSNVQYIKTKLYGTNTHLVVIGDAAVGRGGCDLRCGGSEVTGGHDARLSHAETHDQVVPPQRDVVVTGSCRARLLRIHWTAAGRQKKKRQVIRYFNRSKTYTNCFARHNIIL